MKRSLKERMRNNDFFYQLKWMLIIIVFLMVLYGFYVLYR